MRTLLLISAAIFAVALAANASAQTVTPPGTYIGNYSANPYAPRIEPQRPGAFTDRFGDATISPRLYDSRGQFRGNL